MERDAFSLVIPTFNRPVFLQRLLNYYCDLRASFGIVVADSSSGSALEENLSMTARAQQILDVKHQAYPSDTAPYKKLTDALGKIKSEYAAICADDDFITPDGVAAGVEFLQHNSGYSIAHGCAAAVWILSGGEIQGASTYPQRSIELDDAAARLEDHLRDYTATYYSIHRREQLVSNMERADAQTVDYRLGELLPSCLSVIQGKAKALDVLYMVRQADFEPPKYGEKMLAWDDLITRDDFPDRYEKFRACLADELTRASSANRDEANRVVDGAFLSYISATVSSKEDRATFVQRLRQIFRGLPLAPRLATMGRSLLGKKADTDKHDEMSLPNLLDPHSSFHSQFMNIYRYLDPKSVVATTANGR